MGGMSTLVRISFAMVKVFIINLTSNSSVYVKLVNSMGSFPSCK